MKMISERRIVTSLLVMTIASALTLRPLYGQEPKPPGATRHLTMTLTDQEWSDIRQEDNPTKRVRKLLNIAANRLTQAYSLAQQEQFADIPSLLGQYKSIVTYAMDSVDSLPEPERRRQRNAYKEFDLNLRKHIPMLNEVKRNFPNEHPTVEDSLLTAQRLRMTALNRFSGAEIFKIP
jgi:hypothetical protein